MTWRVGTLKNIYRQAQILEEKMTEYAVIIEKANNNYSAYAPDLPGCITTGPTVEETLSNMREAIEFHLEGIARRWRTYPGTNIYRGDRNWSRPNRWSADQTSVRLSCKLPTKPLSAAL